jgi:sugar phosphate isomerase/epimerase
MLLGYNTNGLAFHRWQDGLELLAEVGYRSVAITVDQHCLNPFAPNFVAELHEMQRLLGRLQLRSVIETGARFLLDPRQKHEPTLISPTAEGRSCRVGFLCRCIDIAKELQSDAVSFWSGLCRDPSFVEGQVDDGASGPKGRDTKAQGKATNGSDALGDQDRRSVRPETAELANCALSELGDVPFVNPGRRGSAPADPLCPGLPSPDPAGQSAWQWLLDGCRRVTDYAEQRGVQLAFEPEPGMLIETLEQYGQLTEQVGSPRFGVTIDIGHVQCVEDGAIADHLRRWAKPLCNVHIEDMRRGVHEHLRFGEGEIDFPPVMAALREIGYTGCVNVELSRHSHIAPEVLRESFEFLSRL